MIVKPKTILIKLIFLIVTMGLLKAQVDVIGNKFFTIDYQGSSVALPIFSNMELNENNIELEKVIIVMHGQNRNASDYFNSINSITSSIGLQNETLIIAPQFLLLEDIEHWDLGSTIPYWQNNTGWTTGNQSLSTLQHPRDFQLSSFTIIDSLLSFIHSEFSSTEEIVLVGNSAGGQLLNRYAGGSPIAFNEKIKFIISAPSSFLYFDENRYEYPNSWTLPSGCNNYNEYKYGLDDLNNYMSIASADSIIARYQKRKITYLVGEQDNGGTTDCQSMVQGQHRLERSLNYYNYLQHYFSQDITDKQKIIIIPNVDHYHDEIFSSPCGKKAIFDIDGCEQIENLTGPTALFSSNISSGNYPLSINFINSSFSGTYEIEHSLWGIEQELIYNNENLEYTFNYPGEHDAELIVIDKIGLRDTLIIESYIKIDTLFGDINLDTQINSDDVETLLSYAVGEIELNPIQIISGDVDNNETLSPFDGSLILQYIEGQLNQIPIDNSQEFIASGALDETEIPGAIDEIIQVPIVLENTENVYSFKATINYDNNELSSATIYAGPVIDLGFKIETKIEDDGTILIAGAGPLSINENITIANLYFISSEFSNGETILFCNDLILNNTQITETYSIKISQILSINESSLPHDFYLGTNFPNPFNSRTKINFSLNRDFKIKLEIKNLKGQLIRSLLFGKYQKGTHNIIWDGKDDSNRPVVSGIYVYTLKVNKKSTTKKMLYLK